MLCHGCMTCSVSCDIGYVMPNVIRCDNWYAMFGGILCSVLGDNENVIPGFMTCTVSCDNEYVLSGV